MRGGVLAAMLLCIALGMALAFAPARMRKACLALLAMCAALGFAARVPSTLSGAVFLASWISVIACAAAVHLPRGVPATAAALLSVDAGLCAGMLIALEGRRRLAIAARVASSWLIAIAVLAAALPYLPVTPGYLPDHLE